MIEIALGALLIVTGLAILFGPSGVALAIAGFDPLNIFGYGGAIALLALGALVVAWGMLRRAMARHPGNAALPRVQTAFGGSLLVAALVAFPVTMAEALNLVRIAGIPFGYYLAAHGALIALAATAFLWVARDARRDPGEQSGE